MLDAVICEPLRTPVGRFGGVFTDIAPQTLAATLIIELLARTGLPPSRSTTSSWGRPRPMARRRRSAVSPHSTPGSASRSPACRSTGAAVPDSRP